LAGQQTDTVRSQIMMMFNELLCSSGVVWLVLLFLYLPTKI
jgi:hypothetical protein